MPHVIYTIPIPTKISGCSLWNRSGMLGSAERRQPRLTTHEVIFEIFQPMWLRFVPQHHRRTDGRTAW